MRANLILESGFSIACENMSDFTDKKMLLEWVNLAILKCKDANDLYNEKNNIQNIKVHKITDLYGEINMCDYLCSVVIPYFIAECLYRYRNDYENAQIMHGEYTDALSKIGSCEKSIGVIY